jgi:hypothetical protein
MMQYLSEREVSVLVYLGLSSDNVESQEPSFARLDFGDDWVAIEAAVLQHFAPAGHDYCLLVLGHPCSIGCKALRHWVRHKTAVTHLAAARIPPIDRGASRHWKPSWGALEGIEVAVGSLQWVELADIVERHYEVDGVPGSADEVERLVQASDHMSVAGLEIETVAGAEIETVVAKSGYGDADYQAVVVDLAAVGDGLRLKAAHIVPGVEAG